MTSLNLDRSKRIFENFKNEHHDLNLLKNKGLIEFLKNKKSDVIDAPKDILIDYIISKDPKSITKYYTDELNYRIKTNEKWVKTITDQYKDMYNFINGISTYIERS